jgi:hypothetical protein
MPPRTRFASTSANASDCVIDTYIHILTCICGEAFSAEKRVKKDKNFVAKTEGVVIIIIITNVTRQ